MTAAKVLSLLVIAAVASTGYCVTEILLPDTNRMFSPSALIPNLEIGIAKWPWETVVSCHITYPNGNIYEVYPNNNIPFTNVGPGQIEALFGSCSVIFERPLPDASGTYEIWSLVSDADDAMTLSRQKHHVTINEWVEISPRQSDRM